MSFYTVFRTPDIYALFSLCANTHLTFQVCPFHPSYRGYCFSEKNLMQINIAVLRTDVHIY